MLKVCKGYTSTISLEEDKRSKNIERLSNYLNSTNESSITVDISKINIIDAGAIATIGSAMLFITNPESEINWIVNSKKVKEYTTNMNIGNSQFIYKK
jgi:hypothetical protein